MNISELIQKHPELKIRVDSQLLQDPLDGTLFVKSGNQLLQVLVKEGVFTTKNITTEIEGLRRVEDITESENMGD